ncbi:GIY-YIG nuclease family protein [Candidatus Roizmanbacteria bacterium]|nr:GIY-YIG nuclease family protein [Candidatus Roizmanbacteria bacterium]
MENNFFVYVLYNKIGNKIYIGYTNNLTIRLLRHNKYLPSKKSSFTSKNKGLWSLIYRESYINRKEAIKREKWLKSGIGRSFVHKNLKEWIIKSQLVDPP